MADPHPRYVVREMTGGSFFDGEGRGRGSNNWNAARRLEAAEATCSELNAEHDAWLAAG